MTSRVYPTTSGMRHLVLIDVLSLTLHAAKYNVFIMVCTAKTSIEMRIAMCAEKIATILTDVHTKCHIYSLTFVTEIKHSRLSFFFRSCSPLLYNSSMSSCSKLWCCSQLAYPVQSIHIPTRQSQSSV